MLVIPTEGGAFGGTEQVSLELARGLARRNMKVIVLEVGNRVLEEHGMGTGATFDFVPATSFADVGRAEWKLQFDRHSPDVVIRVKGWFGSQNRALDLYALLHRAVYLSWECHPSTREWGAGRRGLVRTVKRKIRDLLHRHAVKKTLAVSKAVRDPLVAFQGFSPGAVDVVYPGVDFERFAHAPIARLELRDQWGIPRSALVIGYFGRLVPHKRVDLVLETFARLLRLGYESSLWCVIAGVGSEQENLRALAERLGITERVRFVGWQESAADALSTIDVFLMPSTDEGLGLTLIEAAGSSCLVIAAGQGGMREVMDGELAAYQVAPDGNVDDWVDACERLLAHRAGELVGLQTRFREDLRTRFDSETQLTAMAQWIEGHMP
jgi:glycosyltransferase involved in cell wall biosynthesis